MLSPLSMRLLKRFHSSGRWFLRVPLAEGVAEGVDPLLGARFFLVAARAAEGRVETALGQRIQQRSGLQQAAAFLRAQAERVGAVVDSFGIGVHDQPRADLRAEAVAELHHFAEFVGGIDVQQRERDRARMERLLRQAHHHRGILADGVEHHRPLEFGGHFAQDMDAFGFQRPQMGKCSRGHELW